MTRDAGRRRERRGRGGIKQTPWRHYQVPYKPVEILSADQIEAIHDSSLKVLEEIGMRAVAVAAPIVCADLRLSADA